MAKQPEQDPTVDTPDAEESRTRMTFGEHLDELRKCVVRAGIGIVIAVGVCLAYMGPIFDYVAQPYLWAMKRHGMQPLFTTLKPQEGFFTYINLAFRVGLLVASPWIIFQIWKFVGSGLYKKERKIVYRYVGPSAFLFLLGVAFFYFIVLPMTLNFFLTFTAHTNRTTPKPGWIDNAIGLGTDSVTTQPAATNPATMPVPLHIPVLAQNPPAPPAGESFVFFNSTDTRLVVMVGDREYNLPMVTEDALFANNWRADDYLNFVAFTALIFGLAFELPMVILVLCQTDMVRPQTFRNVRKYAYFGILIGAVIAAPSGDLMTLAFLFIPLVLLYELGIVAGAIVTRGRKYDD